MTRIKVSLVAGSVLSGVARELGLADALIVGESERGTGGRGLTSALENTYEALTAALYLDAGHRRRARVGAVHARPAHHRGRSGVARRTRSPRFRSSSRRAASARATRRSPTDGPPHDRIFTVAVEVDGERLGTGAGRTKREAEALAAAAALEALAKPAAKRRSKA